MADKKTMPEGKTQYDIIYLITKEALLTLDAVDENSRKTSKEIYDHLKSTYSEIQSTVQFSSFQTTLSIISKDENSEIVKAIGKQGYYLNRAQAEIIKSIEVTQVAEIEKEKEIEKKEREKEKLLYPVLVEWLKQQKYRAKDTSAYRQLGKWGNPDITGIRVDNNIGSKEVEIVTIEAKTSIDYWQYNIFEAVAHRRYANRSYFAFAYPEDSIRKLPNELRYYSELYSVGVLIVGLTQDDYSKLIKGQLKKLENDSYEIVELHNAPYHPKQIKYQKDYCLNIEIKEESDLYTWGA